MTLGQGSLRRGHLEVPAPRQPLSVGWRATHATTRERRSSADTWRRWTPLHVLIGVGVALASWAAVAAGAGSDATWASPGAWARVDAKGPVGVPCHSREWCVRKGQGCWCRCRSGALLLLLRCFPCCACVSEPGVAMRPHRRLQQQPVCDTAPDHSPLQASRAAWAPSPWGTVRACSIRRHCVIRGAAPLAVLLPLAGHAFTSPEWRHSSYAHAHVPALNPQPPFTRCLVPCSPLHGRS